MRSKILAAMIVACSATLAVADEPRSAVVPAASPYGTMTPGAVSGLRWTGTDLINYGGPCFGVPCAPWQSVPWYGPWDGHGHGGYGAYGRGCRAASWGCGPGCRY